MTAARAHRPADDVRGVNTILRRDGSRIHLDDIATAAQGQALLDEIDAAILRIEDQVERHDGGETEWLRRASSALRKKRRLRPALQHRIAELRRAERESQSRISGSTKPHLPPGAEARNARRVAFINAAEAVLDRDLFVEIWQRASQAEPAAFAGSEGRP